MAAVPITAPPQAIETGADRMALRAFVKTTTAGEAFGAAAPCHSVLTWRE
jgi:hypothetical protein